MVERFITPGGLRAASAALLGVTAIAGLSAWQPRPQGRLMFVGTYTGGTTNSKGIYAFRFDEASGGITPLGLAAETTSPSFLALSPSKRVLLAVNEVGTLGGTPGGGVTSYAIDGDRGTLTRINEESSRGADPCHLQCDQTGRFVAVANYTGGNLGLFPMAEDGRLSPATVVVGGKGKGPNVQRQAAPHAHQAVFDPSNRFLIAADLGIDQLLVYRFDAAAGTLVANTPPSATLAPGSGPRHFAFHPNGRLLFTISELLSTVTTFSWDGSKGVLGLLGTVSTLPSGYSGQSSTAEIAVHPNGRFLYGSNRGHDSIAVFSIAANGTLTLVEHESTRGRTPRHFSIDPSGRWLIAANQDTATLAVFAIDPTSGALSPVGPLTSVGSPVCVLFMP